MSLTVIGGKFKRHKLCTPAKNKNLRPILARVKKSLFDILQPKIKDAKFLDLYAGTGSVGIEALSRGAKYAVFVDNDSVAIKTINKNLTKLNLLQKATVYRKDISSGLEFLGDAERNRFKFDIVFIGPPYKDFIISKTLENIAKANIIKKSTVVVAQHHKTEKIKIEKFSIFREKKYGDTILSFLRMKSSV
ncbi:MAG: 16S rRNA (guanine(966)-N(2))-methyltransferase RsmD [Elusimicrobiota bacterium]|nr:16S rRNA (guanine(966)-N(2))-methyltransferase RsmD [Elusimicrobiota bacterium]